MDKDKEPTLTDFYVAQDDLRRQRPAAARPAASTPRPAVATPTPAPAKQRLATFAFLLVLALGAVVVFLFMQLQSMQQQLAASQAENTSQQQSLSVLNDKLSVTGENANLSVDALRAIVKEQESEIRKLWDLAGKKNRNDIAANAKDIATLKASVIKSNTTLEQQAANQAQAVTALETRLNKADVQLKALPEVELRLSQQSESLDSAQKDLKALKQKDLAALKKEIEQLKKSGVGMDAASIRLQLEDINIRLDRMQNAIGGK